MLRFSSDAHTQAISSLAKTYFDYEGYLYHQWTPMVGSSIASYPFKIWLDIIEAPPHTYGRRMNS
jgi:hypothetical protein